MRHPAPVDDAHPKGAQNLKRDAGIPRLISEKSGNCLIMVPSARGVACGPSMWGALVVGGWSFF